MTELSYQSIRTANQAREADEVRTDSRKKNLLVLVLNYLKDEGYYESSQTLARETNLDLSRYEVCDNIDLETVLMEYESYYYVKFAKYPKLTKKLAENAGDDVKNHHCKNIRNSSVKTNAPSLPRIPNSSRPSSPITGGRGLETQQSGNGKRLYGAVPLSQKPVAAVPANAAPTLVRDCPVASVQPEGLSLQGITIRQSHSITGSQNTVTNVSNGDSSSRPCRKVGQIVDVRAILNDLNRIGSEEGVGNDERILKPLGGYLGYSSEWRELAQTITRDIYLQTPNVTWEDIIGLDEPKRLMKEAVVYPMKYPQLFQGILSPWKGVMLYGPPGTGKTLLAKAVATECKTTFFNVSASTIVSKWRGDSEKLVRVLFELARFYAPSTIFLDELESLMSQRGNHGGSGEHEGSRRMKTELLIQMDGLAKTDDLVFLLAASNLPWELDHAMLRRLEKRILVDLPNCSARSAMFQHHLPPVVCPKNGGLELLTELDYDVLGMKTDGYSGSDIKLVCKEAAMRPVRKIFAALEDHTEGEELHHVRLDTVVMSDVLAAIDRTKPSAKLLKDRYCRWQRNYESV